MSSSSVNQEAGPARVTRTLRGALRMGDDYWTLEETIDLPITATDEEIAGAVATGLRIYQAQRVAFDSQVGELRDQGLRIALEGGRPEARPSNDAPISDKQQRYMEFLMEQLGWGHNLDRLREFISDSQIQVQDVTQMTKREASDVINALKAHNTSDLPL